MRKIKYITKQHEVSFPMLFNCRIKQGSGIYEKKKGSRSSHSHMKKCIPTTFLFHQNIPLLKCFDHPMVRTCILNLLMHAPWVNPVRIPRHTTQNNEHNISEYSKCKGERGKLWHKFLVWLPVRQLGKIIFWLIILMVNISKRHKWCFHFPFSHNRGSFCNIIMLTKHTLQVIIQC